MHMKNFIKKTWNSVDATQEGRLILKVKLTTERIRYKY